MIAPTSFFADYGCHVRILEEARILQRLGHRVTIATYHNGKNVEGLTIERTLPIPWRKKYEVGSNRHKIAFDALLSLKCLQLAARNRYDVIHAHLHEGALIGVTLSRMFGIPSVFDLQGSMTAEMLDHGFIKQSSLLYEPLRRLERWIDQSCPAILCSSKNSASLLLREFNCPPGQVQVLPDCVNTEVFKPAGAFDPTELATLRHQLGIPEQAKVIVYVGLLAQYQGTDLLLQAMERILRHHNDVYLLLMGFPNIPRYQALADSLGIRHSIIFTGGIPYEHLPPYLALGDVAVAPKLSLTEGCGKLLNYMAAALPTVAFDTPAAREYLGIHGFFASRGDVSSLAEKLMFCLNPTSSDSNMPSRMGQFLRQRALQKFGWVQVGNQLIDTYERVTNKAVIISQPLLDDNTPVD
ncbi:glycosyltransferase family 4 protein [Chloroflexi bacterium TSY]|nr:glycosyltransferase family 4 protein [Chloroflexi bacterium TSY]